jgi:hypothetical protein
MSGIKAINMARGFGYMAGILQNHQREPLCGKCKAFASTTDKVRRGLSALEGSGDARKLPDDMRSLYSEAKSIVEGIDVPAEPIPQRKRGNCNLPDKGCFLKYSAALFGKIQEQ